MKNKCAFAPVLLYGRALTASAAAATDHKQNSEMILKSGSLLLQLLFQHPVSGASFNVRGPPSSCLELSTCG